MTAPRATLPLPPEVELDIVREGRVGEGGFLSIRRMQLEAVRDGVRSKTFSYDALDRRALDASVMASHHVEGGRVYVWLRAFVRPPLALRPEAAASADGTSARARRPLWELPAGLIEPGESAARAAARELDEELGFVVTEADMIPLGPPMAPAPAFIGEVHHFFHVRVDPTKRGEPGGDGSPLEEGGLVEAVLLDDAIDACRRGEIVDSKTELALRRLAETPGLLAGARGSSRLEAETDR